MTTTFKPMLTGLFRQPCRRCHLVHTPYRDGQNLPLCQGCAMLEQAWDALQAVPAYVSQYQCYHAGLAGFFQAIAMLASQEIDPFCLDWEEANEWRDLQDKWELAGGQS